MTLMCPHSPRASAGVWTLVSAWMSRTTTQGQQFTKKVDGKRSLEIPILPQLRARLHPHLGVVRNAQGQARLCWGQSQGHTTPLGKFLLLPHLDSQSLAEKIEDYKKNTQGFVS